jgi:hypothetical protein
MKQLIKKQLFESNINIVKIINRKDGFKSTDSSDIKACLTEPRPQDYFKDKDGEEYSIGELTGETISINGKEEFVVPENDIDENPYSDGSNGWDENALEEEFGLVSWIEEVERLAYEIRSAARGAYALQGDTFGDLVMAVRDLADSISDIADNMENEQDNYRTH